MSSSRNPLASGTFEIQAQERVVFGQPVSKVLRSEVERLGATRVMVTSGHSLSRLADGPLQWVERALGARHAGTFTNIRAHSPREDVIAGAAAARACGADLLVAVGGGSVIDATKAMLMCLWLGLDSVAAMEPFRTGLSRAASRPIVAPGSAIRLVTVSTTLSASEFNPSAGVTDASRKAKQSYRHRLLVPQVVILDPAATLDTPNGLLFSTGIRSVDHAVESYCAPLANPATEVLSLQGLRLLSRALLDINQDSSDLRARNEAQLGMWQSIAASVAGAGTGASHGIGYVLGAGYNVAHGHTSCVMLPAVMRWNAALNGDRQKALSQAMGSGERAAADLVAGLIEQLGQPANLRAVKVSRDDFGRIADRAMEYPAVLANPRPIRSPADVREILELAW
jgi:maleylacetate reductase